jgi:hypothetical protein
MELTDRQQAIFDMLAEPDPIDLPMRGHHLVFEGDANRTATRPQLFTAWLMHRDLATHGEELPRAPRVVGRRWGSTPRERQIATARWKVQRKLQQVMDEHRQTR